MVWRQLHRWLGLVAGTLALVLGITGTLLALDPLRNAWQAAPAAQDLPVATLVQRVQASVPGAEEIRRLPSGGIVVHLDAAGRKVHLDGVNAVQARQRLLDLGDAGRAGEAFGAQHGMGRVGVRVVHGSSFLSSSLRHYGDRRWQSLTDVKRAG